jgi:hypothetical protein
MRAEWVGEFGTQTRTEWRLASTSGSMWPRHSD